MVREVYQKPKFRNTWFFEFAWLRQIDDYKGLCIFCDTEITVAHMGRRALVNHAETKKHQSSDLTYALMEARRAGMRISEVSADRQNPQYPRFLSVTATSDNMTHVSTPSISDHENINNHCENEELSVLKEMNSMENVLDERVSEDGYSTKTNRAGKVTFDQQKENVNHENLLEGINSTENDCNIKIDGVRSLNPEEVIDFEQDFGEEMRKDDFQNGLIKNKPCIYDSYLKYDDYVHDKSKKEPRLNPEISPKRIISDSGNEEVNQDNPDISPERIISDSGNEEVNQGNPDISPERIISDSGNEEVNQGNPDISPKRKISDSGNEEVNQGNPVLRKKSKTNENKASSSAKQTTVHSGKNKPKNKPENEKKKSHTNPHGAPQKITSDPKYENRNQGNPTPKKRSETNKNGHASSSAKQTTVHSGENKSKKKPENEKKKSHGNPQGTLQKITSDPKYENQNQGNPTPKEKSETNKDGQAPSSAKQTTVRSNKNKPKKKSENEKKHSNSHITPKKKSSDPKHEKANQGHPVLGKNSEINSQASSSAKESTMQSNESPKQPENESETHAYPGTSNQPESEKPPSDYPVIADKSPETRTREIDNEISHENELSEQDAITTKLFQNKDYSEHLLSLDNCFMCSTQSMKNSVLLKSDFVKIQKSNGKTKFIPKIKNKYAKKGLAKAIGHKSKLSKSCRDKKTSVETEAESGVPSCSTEPDRDPNTAGTKGNNPNFHAVIRNFGVRLLEERKSHLEKCHKILLEYGNFLSECDTTKFDFIDSIHDKYMPSENGCSKEALKWMLKLCDNAPDFSELDKFSEAEAVSRDQLKQFDGNPITVPSCSTEHDTAGRSSSENSPDKLTNRKNEAQKNSKRQHDEATNEKISKKKKS